MNSFRVASKTLIGPQGRPRAASSAHKASADRKVRSGRSRLGNLVLLVAPSRWKLASDCSH